MRKKVKIKIIAKILLFITVFVGVFYYVQHILKDKNGIHNISTFYDLEENSVDVVFVGTSHPLQAFLPMELWNDYGIPSYNLAQSGQTFPLTYYSIKEAIRKQNPKVIVADLYYIIKDSKYGNDAFTHQTLDNFKWSKVKLEAILYGTDPKLWSELIFPFEIYHNRWSELKERDFTNVKDFNYGAGKSYISKEYGTFEKIDNSITKELSNISNEYLQKMIDLCKENNMELVFTVVPYLPGQDNDKSSSYDQQALLNEAIKIANNHGIETVNYLDLIDEIGFDFKSDMRDPTHVNLLGGKKVTAYIGQYLRDNFNLEDKRQKVEYSTWNSDFKQYKNKSLSLKTKQLEQCENIYGYLDMISTEEDYTVFMTLSGSNISGINDEIIKRFKCMGLKANLKENKSKSYLSIIDGGNLIYEELGNDNIWYKYKVGNEEVTISSTVDESRGKVILDKKDVSVNKEGLNIVVYSKSKNKVIDSVSFDIGADKVLAHRKNKES